MLNSKTICLLACAAGSAAALAPDSAEAARATFAVQLEAQRTVAWDHPRQLLNGDCNGRSYVEGRGGEDFMLKSKAGGRLVVEGGARKLSSWQFGVEGPRRAIISAESPEAKGVITRTRHWVTGTTGGWCGGGEQDPAEPGDCGTRLAPFTFRLSLNSGQIGFRETRGSSPREKYDFYDCQLLAPEGVPVGSLPSLEQKLPLAKLFNRGQATITIKANKAYGPSLTPLPSGGNRSTSAQYDWKLTLKRVRNLRPRSENG